MLAHPTLEQLHALGLHGMAKGFKELEHNPEARGLDHAEFGRVGRFEELLQKEEQAEEIRRGLAESIPTLSLRIGRHRSAISALVSLT